MDQLARSIWLRSLLILLPLVYSVWANPVPYFMEWNTTHVFGPDGPWQAIPLRVGWPEQLINLYPGGSWVTTLLGTGVCEGQPSCAAREAGLYDPNHSGKVSSIANHGIGDWRGASTHPLNPAWGSNDPLQSEGNGTLMSDCIRFDNPNIATQISNFSISVASAAKMALPDRSTVPMTVGF